MCVHIYEQRRRRHTHIKSSHPCRCTGHSTRTHTHAHTFSDQGRIFNSEYVVSSAESCSVFIARALVRSHHLSNPKTGPPTGASTTSTTSCTSTLRVCVSVCLCVRTRPDKYLRMLARTTMNMYIACMCDAAWNSVLAATLLNIVRRLRRPAEVY